MADDACDPIAAARSDRARVGFQPEDLMRFETATDVQLAPSGRYVAVVSTTADPATDSRPARTTVVDTAAGTSVLVTDESTRPAWGPDDTLYLLRSRSGTAALHRWRTGQACPQRRIVELDLLSAEQLLISPTGDRAAITGLAALPDPGRRANHTLIRHRVFRAADGALIPEFEPVLYLVDLECGTARRHRIAEPFNAAPSEDGLGFAADWWPDGRSLVACLAAGWDDRHNLPTAGRQLCRIDLASGEVTVLVGGPLVTAAPAVHPDGRSVAFLRQRGAAHRTTYDFGACVLDVASGAIRAVDLPPDASAQDIAWTDDGASLAIRYLRRGRGLIGIIDSEGTLEQVAAGARGPMHAGRSGIVYVDSSAAHPGTPVLLDRSGRRQHVDRCNTWVRDRHLADTTEIVYPSAHTDRQPIHAILARPPGRTDTREYPVIVDLHGGPYSDSRLEYDPDREFFAAQGFVVLQPNVRGSIGYGTRFLQLSDRKHYPGWFDRPQAAHEMGWDVAGALQAVADQELGDPDRVFLRGFSAGALLTTWVLGRCTGFRAAVAQGWYPGEWGAPMYGWFQGRRYFDHPPWLPGHTEPFWRRSPFAVADRISTPLLLLQGDADYVTPLLEAEKFYYALTADPRRDVALCIFHGETHGLASRPSSHRDSRLVELAWFRDHDRTGGQQ